MVVRVPRIRNPGTDSRAKMAQPDNVLPVSNRILKALPATSLERLRPHLISETLPVQTVLYRIGQPIRKVHFIQRGIASVIKTMQDGRTVEIGGIGIEGMTGANALFDGNKAILECVVQVPGEALVIKSDVLKAEMAQDVELSMLLHAYQSLTISQLAQTAACNRLHTLEQRCCRWLLIAHDSAGNDTFPLTHEFLSMMLGVRRPGVTLAARSLQQSGLIRYTRGRVNIVDRIGLERAACECYGTIHQMIERLFARRN